MKRRLLADDELERSSIVANCTMNRLRTLEGRNGYARELGRAPLEVLEGVVRSRGRAAWLDLCCGSGRALVEAAAVAATRGLAGKLRITGVDLAGHFDPVPRELRPLLDLVEASALRWEPDGPFDLITCVHGLHYVGDRLELIRRAVSWLSPYGLFVASFDAGDCRAADGRSLGRAVARALRAQGLDVDARRRRVACAGRRELRLPFRYLGADDSTGPNYTGQPAVTAVYERLSARGGGDPP